MAKPVLEFDRSVLDREFAMPSVHVTKEMIRTYVEAVEDTNPIYVDTEAALAAGYPAIIAPPAFTSTLSFTSETTPEVQLVYSGAAVTRSWPVGSWMVHISKPIFAGDIIHSTLKIHDIYAKTGRTGPMIFTILRMTFYNQSGELVAEAKQSHISRPGTSEERT